VAAIPWEEDPRFQEANYRLLAHLVVISTALATIYGVAFREWSFLGVWFSALDVVLAGLFIYGAIVYSAGHTIRFLARLVLRAFRRRGPKC